jgi:hypothetical protein
VAELERLVLEELHLVALVAELLTVLAEQQQLLRQFFIWDLLEETAEA